MGRNWFNKNEIPEKITKETKIKTETENYPDKVICIDCKHYKKQGPYSHNCYVEAEEIKDYITGETTIDGIEDCTDINEDGDCSDFERKLSENDS